MKPLDLVRWLAIVPVGVIAWYIALIGGMIVHSLVNDICPYGTVVSGLCTGSWFRDASKVIMNTFVALSAVLVVFSTAWVAPKNKALVAIFSYVIGAIIAVVMAIDLAAWDKLASAIVAGLVAVVLVKKKLQHANESA